MNGDLLLCKIIKILLKIICVLIFMRLDSQWNSSNTADINLKQCSSTKLIIMGNASDWLIEGGKKAHFFKE